MARVFRIWGKKRGDRRTGSQLLGSVGEAVFFAGLFLLAAITLVSFLTVHFASLTSADAQIDAGLSFWLSLLVLSSLLILGVGGFVHNILSVGTSAERRSAIAKKAADIDLLSETLLSDRDYPTIPRDKNLTNSPGIRLAYRLPIVNSPAWKLFSTALFCLVWNGFVSVIVVLAIRSYLEGKPDTFLCLFAIPFAVVGIRSIYRFFQQVLSSTAIGPTQVEVSNLPLVPGKACQVYATQSGRLSVRSLSLFLVCDEEAVFRQGTDVRTERRRVHKQQVFRRNNFDINPIAPFEHQCHMRVPASAMHSFRTSHNAVQWHMSVEAELANKPPFERVFPIVMYPRVPATDVLNSHNGDT